MFRYAALDCASEEVKINYFEKQDTKVWIGLAWLRIKIGILNEWDMRGETRHIWLNIKFVSYINGIGVCR
jgi:hypothetical protein